MKKLLTRVIAGVVLGVAVYVGFSVWADARAVGAALAHFSVTAALGALLLASTNYLVRFVRWHYYLAILDLRIPRGESLLVFLAGFALTVTPGKLGEAVKALLLKESRGIPAARTAPIVIAERLTDLIGLLLLAAAGAFTFPIDRRFLVAGAVVVGLALLVITVEPLSQLALAIAARTPGVRRFSDKLREAHASTAAMVRPVPLLVAVVLSVLSWFFECLAFYLVVAGFPGAVLPLHPATFIYASMTVAGALSFLPGGLGVTEAGMLLLLGQLGTGVSRATSAAATFVTRACTLWFAVAVGLVALVLFARRTHVRIDLSSGKGSHLAPRSE